MNYVGTKFQAITLLFSLSCSNNTPIEQSGETTKTETTMLPGSTTLANTVTPTTAFLPTREIGYERRFGPFRRAHLPLPVRRPTGLRIAMFLLGDVVASRGMAPGESEKISAQVTVPTRIHYLNPASAEIVEDTFHLNELRAARFGIPDPPNLVVGSRDDPNWLPKLRVEELRQHIFAGLDVLLPLFADPNLPWTAAANKAAQEVRDFFPLAAEPGLWPYYKAEGKEFFEWVEKNAPPGKAELPWHAAK